MLRGFRPRSPAAQGPIAIEQLLASYPRRRAALDPAYARIWDTEYKNNREGADTFSALASLAERWMHSQAARSSRSGAVLEIGAGTLNHLAFETWSRITRYDAVEPNPILFTGKTEQLRQIRRVFADIGELDPTEPYDRIISVGVLTSVLDLARLVALTGVLLRPGGVTQHALGSYSSLMFEVAWQCTTGLGFRWRNGLSYRNVVEHELVNTSLEVVAVIGFFFERVRVKYFPGPSHHASIFTYVEATEPRLARCRSYLGNNPVPLLAPA